MGRKAASRAAARTAPPTRRVWYSVASSLDGYIARADGSYDWIPDEDGIDWSAFMGRFDTWIMGRKTYDVMRSQPEGGGGAKPLRTYVFSRTLHQASHPDITVVAGDPAELLTKLRAERGKDIWLVGGGDLFRQLLDAGQVDVVEVGLIPVLLGGGIPFLPQGGTDIKLRLNRSERPGKSGILMLTYDVVRDSR
jgi:dihydrofolate reductase